MDRDPKQGRAKRQATAEDAVPSARFLQGEFVLDCFNNLQPVELADR